MTFKEALQDDLETAYFDEDEFADELVIDGEHVVGIMQDFTNESPNDTHSFSKVNIKESVVKGRFLLYLRENDVKNMRRKKFTANSNVVINGKHYFVEDSKTIGGVTKVTIYKAMV